ncbi:MAG: hypothetical protein AVDCRST_MAG58-1018 [uncultured Rubrobacteraceae bacterium]|uniref:Uncharacterized protein n=1 Tax=uncultured Rubrobacteraceae bacterium TaxID=349277 RepID=A0A6J4R037_9ACTN|nr:MAG: hypothetical protein AVDCRST_MAG58-1018 [uncultured Rubrobacteraceae bacterium]
MQHAACDGLSALQHAVFDDSQHFSFRERESWLRGGAAAVLTSEGEAGAC